MTLDTKTLVIIVLSVLVVVFGYIAFKPTPMPYGDTLIQNRLDSIKSENLMLLKKIGTREIDNKQLAIKNDSLVRVNDSIQKLKQRLSTLINRYENYKSPNISSSIDTMRSIFAENGIN